VPLTNKGEEIMSAMKEQYGSEKGEQVFYASKNKGSISGVDEIAAMTRISPGPGLDAVLNWGSGNYNVMPGGREDSPTMPESASKSTGMGGVTHNTGSQGEKV